MLFRVLWPVNLPPYLGVFRATVQTTCALSMALNNTCEGSCRYKPCAESLVSNPLSRLLRGVRLESLHGWGLPESGLLPALG